jgi:tetratricopeptide (TPR) repeat protein
MPGRFSFFCQISLFWCAISCVCTASEAARDRAILQIQQLIQNGDLTRARAVLAKSASEFPGDAGLDNLSGVIAAQQHAYLDAERSFRRAIERDPRFTAAYLNLGRLYQENVTADAQARQKALTVYERVLHYDKTNAEANYQSAALLLQAGRYQQSLSRLKNLPQRTQESAQGLSLLCANYAGLGDRKQTDDAFKRLMATSDLSEADLRQMLPTLHGAKREDMVVGVLQVLHKSEQLPADLTHALALAYEASGKLDEARTTLEQFVTTDGNLSAAALLELARIAREQKDSKGALGYLAHARDLEPENASIHYSFGLVCLDLDLIAEARNSFQKALKLDPENASYNYAMGVTSTFERDPEDAVPYFQEYLKLRPNEPRAKLALGAALVRAKEYDAAMPLLKEALEDPGTESAAHYYLGTLFLQDGRLEEAASELKLALQVRPDYADALAELGHYYLLRKDYADAEVQLRQALTADPDHLSANFYLLTLYTRNGDARREAQSKRYDELQKLREQKSRDFLRMIEVRPLESQP